MSKVEIQNNIKNFIRIEGNPTSAEIVFFTIEDGWPSCEKYTFESLKEDFATDITIRDKPKSESENLPNHRFGIVGEKISKIITSLNYPGYPKDWREYRKNYLYVQESKGCNIKFFPIAMKSTKNESWEMHGLAELTDFADRASYEKFCIKNRSSKLIEKLKSLEKAKLFIIFGSQERWFPILEEFYSKDKIVKQICTYNKKIYCIYKVNNETIGGNLPNLYYGLSNRQIEEFVQQLGKEKH